MKFSLRHPDNDVQKIQREIEDNLVDTSMLTGKSDKVTAFVTEEPLLTNMKNGQRIAYDDGTNKYIYERIGAKLFKYQLTEV